VDFPIGHRKRRAEGIPVLLDKFAAALAEHLPKRRVEQILAASKHAVEFDALPINHLLDLFAL